MPEVRGETPQPPLLKQEEKTAAAPPAYAGGRQPAPASERPSAPAPAQSNFSWEPPRDEPRSEGGSVIERVVTHVQRDNASTPEAPRQQEERRNEGENRQEEPRTDKSDA